MDDDICRWILEFMLRSSMKDRVLKKVLAAIPVSDKDSRLKKTVLLRAIESELSDAAVTETMLEIFEMIEELDKGEGIAVMESMKAAYCAVAVECTVKYLVGSIDRHGKYFDAVKRIWRGRLTEMEMSGKSELVSRELKGWKDEVEAALVDTNVWKKLTNMNTRNDALRLVGEYLGEAWAVLGPSFLQLSATLIDRKVTKGMQPVQLERKSAIAQYREEVNKTIRVSEDGGGSGIELPSQTTNYAESERQGDKLVEVETKGIDSPNISRDLSFNDGFKGLAIVAVNNEKVRELATETADRTEVQGSVKNRMTDKVSEGAVSDDQNPSLSGADKPAAEDEENLKICVLPRRKFLGSHRRVGGAKISNPDDLENDTSSEKHSSLLTPEVNRVQEALKISSLDLQAAVKDPLPDALRVSEAVASKLAETNKNHEHSSDNRNDAHAANPATNNGDEPLQFWNAALDHPHGGHQNIVPRPSLMERNSTARTFEWHDSIDDSPERISNHTSRLHLPSPKRKAVSPLKKYEVTKFARRRKIKRWSLLEEDTLRTAVQKFGKGNWKLILNSYRDVFEERTEVDLKDKWRNMTRY